jgi:hypothetical protein
MTPENNHIIIYILIICNIFSVIIGYILGKITNTSGVYNTSNIKPTSFFEQNKSTKKSTISIDSTTVVTDIKTDNLEKKYSSLGDTKISNENISSSISKLKSMKGQ